MQKIILNTILTNVTLKPARILEVTQHHLIRPKTHKNILSSRNITYYNSAANRNTSTGIKCFNKTFHIKSVINLRNIMAQRSIT